MEEIFLYSVIPYPSKFFLQTQPDRLATAAALFGMNPVPVENCRVLELGCGNGSNLISQSYNLPESRFVGVDLAENHIAHAKESIKDLDITNTEFYAMDVMKMTVEEFGKFDYIIAHGLFSWVPDFVREKVLAIYREFLTENGVGYISYNAYPGAHSRDMTRNIMMYHARNFSDPMEKVRKSISFLAFLVENSAEKEIYNSILQHELKRHFEHDAADIYHDDLADFFQSFYFHEFAELLDKNDLQFLAEAELHAMSIHSFSPDVREFIESLDSVVLREQYLDFLRGRIFRQTLFCHKNIELNRQIEPSILYKFMLASSIRPESETLDFAPQKVEKFIGLKGMGFEIDHPLTKAALFYLGQSWGKAVPFSELLEKAGEILEKNGLATDNREIQINTTSAIFMQICLGTNLIELHLHQPDSFTEVSEKPVVNKLARWQLRFAQNVITGLNLDVKVEDAVSRHLLELLDGTRRREDLLKDMAEFIKTNDEIEDRQDLLDNLSDWLDDSLMLLAKRGMFEG